MKLVMTSYRLGKMSEGLVKLVMTSYRLEEISGGFGEASYDHL